MVALPLLALTLTRDPLTIAGVVVANRVARAIVAVPAGVVADRYERGRVMVTSLLFAGLVLALLVADMTWGGARLAALYVASVAVSAADVAYEVAAQAMVPVLVPKDHLTHGNSWLMTADGAGEQFVGPGVGGLLFSVAQRLPFGLDAVSFVLAAAVLGRGVGASRREPAAVAAGATNGPAAVVGAAGDRHRGWAAQVADGFRAYRSTPALWRLTSLGTAMAFCQNVVFALLVLFGSNQLHLRATGYGVFFALSAAFGVAGFRLGPLIERRMGTAGMLAGAAAVTGVAFVLLAMVRWWPLAVVVFGSAELATGVRNVGSSTARQRLAPTHLYGRVYSLHRVALGLAAPLGALLGGLLAAAASVPVAFVFAGVVALGLLALLGPGLVSALQGEEGRLGQATLSPVSGEAAGPGPELSNARDQ